MRKRLVAFILLISIFSLIGCGPSLESEMSVDALLKDGSYEASAIAHNGPLTVSVTIKDGDISDIRVVEHSESKGIGDIPIKLIPQQIIENQSLSVDVMTGATFTSLGLINAIEDCIKQAGGNVSDFQKALAKEKSDEVKQLETDILVIGAGTSGLAASLSAADQGVKVILLEKQSIPGGAGILSTGTVQASGSKLQKDAGVEDSAQEYYEDMMELTDGKRQPNLVKLITEKSGETIDWLVEKGVTFRDEVVRGVGSLGNRQHLASPDASGLISPMFNSIEEDENIDVYLDTTATELIVENDRVVGAKAQHRDGKQFEIRAKNVILSVGGFGGNKEMVGKYVGKTGTEMSYVGARGNTGELIEAVINLGADIVDMDKILFSPTTDYERNQLITAQVLSRGGFLVNQKGLRFTNETSSPGEYFEDIMATGDDYVLELFDSQVLQHVPHIENVYIKQGIVQEADTIEELAEKMDVPYDLLKKEIETFNASVAGEEDPFGRSIFGEAFELAPFYFVKVTPGIVTTNGGLLIDDKARVIRGDGSPIEGLFATGDAAGGYRPYGYVSGDANAFALLTGRVAGEEASKINK